MQVLRLPAVGSKRFLTTKVDRCVTGERSPHLQSWREAIACEWAMHLASFDL